MKKLLFFALLLTFFTACKNESAEPTTTGKQSPQMNIAARSCYVHEENGDSILLKLTILDKKVMGTLNYNFAQKDDSQGSLEGARNEDKTIIYADYTFFSEGVRSVQEVAFKRMGNNLVQGVGEMTEMNGKMVFKDKNAINFENNLIFHTVMCIR